MLIYKKYAMLNNKKGTQIEFLFPLISLNFTSNSQNYV